MARQDGHRRVMAAGIVALAMLAAVGRAGAAMITWQAPTGFVDNTVVMSATGGYAVSFGPAGSVGATSRGVDPTAGVTFTDSSSSTATVTGMPTLATVFLDGLDNPSTSGDLGFDAVLTTGADNSAANSVGTVTLNDLVPSQSYALQLFFVDARTGSGVVGRSFEVSNGMAGGAMTTGFQYAYGGVPGNQIVGAQVTGTFTADATTQTFTTTIALRNAAAGTQINALVLQAVAAPEPGTLGVAGVGAAALLMRRRRRET